MLSKGTLGVSQPSLGFKPPAGKSTFGAAMRQRILGSHTPPCRRRMVITTLSSMSCLAALQRRPYQCQLLPHMRHSRWLCVFFGCLGQLAPTTLPQRRLASNLSLCGPLSLSVLFLFALPRGYVLLFALPRGFLFLFALPTGFSLSLSSLCLCLILPPPSACPCNSGVPPFARRRAQQRVEEPYNVPCDRVCLPEECFLKQPYQISSARQPHVQAVSIPTH